MIRWEEERNENVYERRGMNTCTNGKKCRVKASFTAAAFPPSLENLFLSYVSLILFISSTSCS